MHYTRGLTRGTRAQENESFEEFLSNGSNASEPSTAPEPAAPSCDQLANALLPLLHELRLLTLTACLLEARSTHVELGQGAQVAHAHCTQSLPIFVAVGYPPSCI